MDDLAFELKTLALRRRDGSFITRAQRHRGLQLVGRELRALGYGLPGARSLKPKHVEALVAHWKASGVAPGTLKNRLAWVRDWAADVGKSNVVPRTNAELGIPDRHAFKGDRARVASGEQLSALPDRLQLVVRLQMAFGLRLEESLKLRVAAADRGDALALQASWCKGKVARQVPLVHPRQRALLDEVHALCGTGSLIPDGLSYISFRKQVEHAARRVGIRNMHGHRHWYAQWRYQALTGRLCPAAGGDTYERLSRVERAADYRARMRISRELGHQRLDVTDTYLGARFARKAAR